MGPPPTYLSVKGCLHTEKRESAWGPLLHISVTRPFSSITTARQTSRRSLSIRTYARSYSSSYVPTLRSGPPDLLLARPALRIFIHKSVFLIHKTDHLIHNTDVFIHKSDVFIHKSDVLIHKSDVLIHKTDVLIHKSDVLIHKTDVLTHKIDNKIHKSGQLDTFSL